MKVKLAAAPRDANWAPLQRRPRGGTPCLTMVMQDAAAKPCFPLYVA